MSDLLYETQQARYSDMIDRSLKLSNQIRERVQGSVAKVRGDLPLSLAYAGYTT